ncbi:hypothetical protein [Gluconobacter cerinus]|uniref:hypothetical protein n=1 Tax=Gluconobacter cerinus TaxID=38307 RepID=UPI001B8A976F|nr:hypothetical protein [Gluconobacter cerinus]MBS1038073.1 hypothetical protein [Gluconobacter cerinus]
MTIEEDVKLFPEYSREWVRKHLENEGQKNQYPDHETIINTRDWLRVLEPDSELYSIVDRISWENIQICQTKWHETHSFQSKQLKEGVGDISPVIDLENGLKWVKLESPESKHRENRNMNIHINAKTIPFSLRDDKNQPHVTVEFDNEKKKFERIMSEGSWGLHKKYYEDILKLYKYVGADNYDLLLEKDPEDYDYCHNTEKYDYYAVFDEKYVYGEDAIAELPDDTVFDLVIFPGTHAVSNGRLYIGDEKILSCPENTVFDYVLLRRDSKIKEWNYDVLGDLDVYGTKELNIINGKIGGKIISDKPVQDLVKKPPGMRM